MPRTPTQLAEACFAVARSATHPGERQAAIGRGEAICRRHHLPLDAFNIPGRRRACPPPRVRTVEINLFGDTQAEFAAGLERLRRALEDAGVRAGAADGEAPYHAQRRNFDAATSAARERDRAREGRR